MRKPTREEVIRTLDAYKFYGVDTVAMKVMALFEDDHDPIPAKVGICEECGRPYEDRPKSANLNEHWELTCPCGQKSEVEDGMKWVVCGCGRRIEFGGVKDKPTPKWEEEFEAFKLGAKLNCANTDTVKDFFRDKLRELYDDVRKYSGTFDQVREKWGL